MGIDLGILAAFYNGTGGQVGYTCNGLLYFPYQKGGMVFQDANGALWLVSIFTDGTFQTEPYIP